MVIQNGKTTIAGTTVKPERRRPNNMGSTMNKPISIKTPGDFLHSFLHIAGSCILLSLVQSTIGGIVDTGKNVTFFEPRDHLIFNNLFSSNIGDNTFEPYPTAIKACPLLSAVFGFNNIRIPLSNFSLPMPQSAPYEKLNQKYHILLNR
jgi:hypothetical protein